MRTKQLNIVHVAVNEHAPIFYELIELVSNCLQAAGIKVTCTTNVIDPDHLNVIVGHTIVLPPELFQRIHKQTRNYYIIFQMEALSDLKGVLPNRPAYFDFVRGATQVWDYSLENRRYLLQRGVTNVHYIPIGYSASLERVAKNGEQNIDVLFYGAPAARRIRIIEQLRRGGINAELIAGAYGPVRNDYIARSKILLNIHQFETAQFEPIRVSFLLNNQRFVISETSADNPYGEGIVICNYEDIVERCHYYLKPGMECERKSIAISGYERLKQIPMAESMITALAELRSRK
jgi:hypothetical protein